MRMKATKSVSAGAQISISDDPILRQGLDWDDFRVFAAVAKEGNFHRAAKVLGVQQPTIGRRIQNLESRLGVKLIDRNSRGMTLTYEGRRMADTAEAMAMMVSKAVSRAFIAEQEIEGECKLAMSDGVATGWFIPYFLGTFCARYPRVVLRLAAAPDADKIVIPPYDIQIRYAPAHDDELMTFRIATYHFTYFASRGYIEQFGLPKTADDLSSHRLVDVTAALSSDTGLMAQYSNASALGRPYIYTNSGNIVFEAVAAGQAIGLLPTYTFLLAPDFVPVIPGYHFELGVFVYFTDAASKRPSTRGMIEFLRDVVFDKQHMPWFEDEYQEPADSWHGIFAELCRDAPKHSKILSDHTKSLKNHSL